MKKNSTLVLRVLYTCEYGIIDIKNNTNNYNNTSEGIPLGQVNNFCTIPLVGCGLSPRIYVYTLLISAAEKS
ncbi:MAG: hypothetical protein KGZ58_03070 [Ignavibacteriales bacterium]|nr:hypothetical protein [Ignavibacteriales bacterium]